MARSLSLSQTLTRYPLFSTTTTVAPTSFAAVRRRSNLPEGETATEESETVSVKCLEDAIHKIIVKRSEPDWIALVPGASYWVPPKSTAQGLAHVLGKLVTNSTTTTTTTTSAKLTINNKSSFSVSSSSSSSSHRGWPSSAHFFKGATHSPLEGEITSKHASQSEDEEG